MVYNLRILKSTLFSNEYICVCNGEYDLFRKGEVSLLKQMGIVRTPLPVRDQFWGIKGVFKGPGCYQQHHQMRKALGEYE